MRTVLYVYAYSLDDHLYVYAYNVPFLLLSIVYSYRVWRGRWPSATKRSSIWKPSSSPSRPRSRLESRPTSPACTAASARRMSLTWSNTGSGAIHRTHSIAAINIRVPDRLAHRLICGSQLRRRSEVD